MRWNAPAYVGIGCASYRFQAGVQSIDLILVFVSEEGLQAMIEENLKLGVNIALDSGIYSYSRTKGLFAGSAIEEAVMTFDDGANETIYGEGVTGAMLLAGEKIEPAEEVHPFLAALNQNSADRSIRWAAAGGVLE